MIEPGMDVVHIKTGKTGIVKCIYDDIASMYITNQSGEVITVRLSPVLTAEVWISDIDNLRQAAKHEQLRLM